MSTTSLSRGRRGRSPQRVGRPMLAFIMTELQPQGAGSSSSLASLTNSSPSPSTSLDLAELLAAVQAAIKGVAATLRSSGLVKWRSAREAAAEIFINYIASSHSVALLVCDEKVIPVDTGGDHRGKYVVCVSPLDSKQDTADPPSVAGTVFSVHRYLEPSHPRSAPSSSTGRQQPRAPAAPGARHSLRSVLQPGRNLVAAGYALYASSTTLVLSTGQSPGVHLFVLDPVLGEFILTAPNLTIPDRGRIYSVDEGLTYEWGDPIVGYVESKKDPKRAQLGAPYGAHHVGCTVADVHAVLRNGGIFLSPQTRACPGGTLRLVLEAAPLAHLVCRAGGLATDGHTSLTDCQPEGLAHRTAAFLGSREDIRDLLALFRRNSALYTTRPSSSLRPGSTSTDTVTPSTSTTTTIATQPPSKEQRSVAREKDKGRCSSRAALAEAELTASMATLSATLEALRSTTSRPTSAVYPSSTGSMLGLVPSVQRPASAASAPSSFTSGAGPLPYSLAHTKRVP